MLLAALSALALEPVLDVSLAGSYFPEGAKVATRPGVKIPLWNQPDSVLFEDTWLRPRLILESTPSYARFGPELGFSPIAVFELSGGVMASPYFGTFSSVKPLVDPDAVPDDATLDPLDRHTGMLIRLQAEATIQAKAGPVVIAAWGGPQRWSMNTPAEAEGDYYYEPETELILAWQDTSWSLNGVLLYDHVLDEARGHEFLVGGYVDWHAGMATHDEIVRAGLMGVYRPTKSWAVVLLALAQLEHRDYTEPFPPYLALQGRWTLVREDGR